MRSSRGSTSPRYEVRADAAAAADLFEKVQGYRSANTAKGLVNLLDGVPVGAVLYDVYNGANVFAHIASTGGRWLTREFLAEMFHYPFVTLGCRRITGFVDASNFKARKLNKHLGFRAEAVLGEAAADGGDVIVYVMFREDCRYVAPI